MLLPFSKEQRALERILQSTTTSIKGCQLKRTLQFPKEKQLFPDMCHFWHLDITKVMLRYSMCSEMQHYILQTSAVSTHGLPLKARLVQSVFASTVSITKKQNLSDTCPTNLFNVSDTLAKEYRIHSRTFPIGKAFLSIAASIEAFHYEETLHSVKKNNYSPNRVYFRVYQFLVYPERFVAKAKMCEGCFTAAVHNSSKTNLPSSLSGFKIQD